MKIDPANLELMDAHHLLTSSVVPRPIAFVSTIGADGVNNVAAFSCFAALAMKPMLLGFGIGGKRDGSKKDTIVNIEFTRDFVINVVNEAIAEAMNKASADYPSDVDEFKEAGLTPVKADVVRSPMVGESPINMECRVHQILELSRTPRLFHFVIGEVVRVHIKDEIYIDGEINQPKLAPIGRMGGGMDLYCRTTDLFEMTRPEPGV